jgi:hypothetical protein
MSLENWATNGWLEKLESDRAEIERLLANADGHLADYDKAVALRVIDFDKQSRRSEAMIQIPHSLPRDRR